jgi:predicted ATPase
MITRVSIHNFKCLRDVQIDLERFTVFVGPNASGKSSVLQALDLLCRTFSTQHVGAEVTDIQQGLTRGVSESAELAGETAGWWYRSRTGPPGLISLGPGAGKGWSGEGRGVAADLDSAEWQPWQPKGNDQPPLPASVLLRLEMSRLILPNPSFPDPTIMTRDGTGLHSALASMALNDPDSWQALQTDLRRIIPSIRRLRHTRTSPPALLFDTIGGDSLEANQVSEGTLLVLGLLAALYAPDRPSLVLLDDLDRGLHPKAQKDLVTLLRGLLEANKDRQIVATTHSPYLLNWMEPSEVRMTHLLDDGFTACAPLTEHPKFQAWKDEFSPGEMWSMFGEKWLAEVGGTV